MIENLRPEEEKIIKDMNLFRLKKETNLEILKIFEHDVKENYYKPVTVSNFWCNNYIEYESSGDKNKTLSVEEYLNKTRSYLKDIK